MTNPGKYSMCLNMKHPRAGKVTERLVKWADVVVDNFRPGVLDKWHLSYEEISAIKPEIVMASLTARGHTGPLRTVGGYGSEIAGLIGLNTITGWPDTLLLFQYWQLSITARERVRDNISTCPSPRPL
jgi:crotonobetainyl-CoA:carnitine CoA-transferase CaiB-like acyl-CoA transferase